MFFAVRPILPDIFTHGRKRCQSQIFRFEPLKADGMPILRQKLHLVGRSSPMGMPNQQSRIWIAFNLEGHSLLVGIGLLGQLFFVSHLMREILRTATVAVPLLAKTPLRSASPAPGS